MPRPIHATISTCAFAHNLALAGEYAGCAGVWAVVKANAYGHGIARAYQGCTQTNAPHGFAFLDLQEAAQLRELGWRGALLWLEGLFSDSDLVHAKQYALTLVVHHAEQIRMLECASESHRYDIYLKMNSGMNRLGFSPASYRSAYTRLRALANVGAISHMTHFANADRVDGIDSALECFLHTCDGLPGGYSLANSASILGQRLAHALLQQPGHTVRPGIMLYGASPFLHQSGAALGLRPVMSLRSELIAVREIPAGAAVGYGSRFIAPQPMRIGVVACGYGDGYPRVAPDGTPVQVASQRTRLIGQVSMDMLTVDLTAIPEARVGTPVELWGEAISVDEVAQAAGTIGYELLCGLAARVPVITIRPLAKPTART